MYLCMYVYAHTTARVGLRIILKQNCFLPTVCGIVLLFVIGIVLLYIHLSIDIAYYACT